MLKKPDRNELRERRHLRVRKKVFGTPARPRLCVFRSLKHIYAQIIDDESQKTLVAAGTLDPELRSQLKSGGNIEAAKKVGQLIAQRALQHGIKQVVFDRGGYLYHGRVKALAEAARAGGLEF
ncbi:MAG TPA: 50S ribosomal protein L18 [Firmicutes bacterium]|nr:50S ribosomal protein L18 [Bacillota bacterium]